MSEKEPVVLCAASSYEQKYYLNEAFSGLPTAVKEELQVMCVLYTADVGGILTLQFDEDGNLQFQVTSRMVIFCLMRSAACSRSSSIRQINRSC